MDDQIHPMPHEVYHFAPMYTLKMRESDDDVLIILYTFWSNAVF